VRHFLLLGLIACKSQETARPEPPPASLPVAPTPTVSAPLSATVVATALTATPSSAIAAAAIPATAIPATASGKTVSSANAKLTGTGSGKETAAAALSIPASVSAKVRPPSFASASGPHFTLGLAAPGTCAPNTDCAATLTLTATEGYHINKDYPYTFTADPRDGVTYLGKGGSVFSKANGEFQQVSETVGATRVGFRAAQSFELSGTFKMSVCSEANCQLEVQKIALRVPLE
jgi:hypothetical protein